MLPTSIGPRINLTLCNNLKQCSRLQSTRTILKTPSAADLPKYLKSIEAKWRPKLERRFERERFYASKDGSHIIKPKYILSMFPYPSGKLHLGHVRIYTSADLLSRFSKLLIKGDDKNTNYSHVINPMGFDSFGLPAENAARERGLNPAKWTNSNIRTMKQQMDDLGLQFDWREATSNPSYYKWTQELFLKLKNANLVYKSFSRVNWDPVDKTVLADEQVDEFGRSWRSGAIVEKRNLKQWFVKVNALTNALYEANEIDQTNWRDILSIQRNWIGKPCGWLFYLAIKTPNNTNELLLVFTKQPEMFARTSTSIRIHKDHWLEEVFKISSQGQVHNPFTGKPIHVDLTDDLGSIPANCQATLVDKSADEDDLLLREQVLLRARLDGLGGYYTSETYRDWLVSRQRYWGTPIPVIDCNNCGPVGVHTDQLPVKLPEVADFIDSARQCETNEIVSPIEKLASRDWLMTKCPSCGSVSTRECDTLDTLFDSSWYFLRYSSSPLADKAFDCNYVQPVSTYIGGKEHAAMHLFYARFMTHFLESLGELDFKEPFTKLLMQAVVKSKTYKFDGRYLLPSELETIKDKSKLVVDYEKMSKSKGNGVDPQQLVNQYGIDATRLCLMSYANPKSERLWRSNTEEFKEIISFMRRLCLTVEQYVATGNHLLARDSQVKPEIKELSPEELELDKSSLINTYNKCLLDGLFFVQVSNEFRQFISCLHVLHSALRSRIKTSTIYTREYANALGSLIVMLNPIIPHLSEELWGHFSLAMVNPLKHRSSGYSSFNLELQSSDQPWPLPDEAYPRQIKIRMDGVDDKISPIQIDGLEFKNLSESDIGTIVSSHHASLGHHDCSTASVVKYMNLVAFVDIICPSLKAKFLADKKTKKINKLCIV